MTRAREYENEAEELRKRVDVLEDLLTGMWSTREKLGIYGISTGSYKLYASAEDAERIRLALGIKEE